MKLERWALVAEITGGIAIVLSLVFVALEIRQDSQSRTQVMTQALVSSYTDTVRLLAQDESLRCIYIIGTQDYSRLSGKDQIALSAYFLALFRHREDLYYQHLEGAINPDIWKGFEAATREVVKYSGFRQWFEMRRDWFSDPFQIYIEGLMSGQPRSVPFDDSGCSLAD